MAGPGPSAEFVHAVSLSFDVTAEPSLRSQANASLEQLRQSEEGWHWVLQQFGAATEEHVKFWCLQTLVDMVSKQQRYAGLQESQKQTLRQALVAWLQAKGGPHTDQPASVKNKFAQLLVAILRVDYPSAWPDVFPILLGTLPNGPVSIDLFLRVLNALNDEVVVNEEGNGYDSDVAARVKDGMRERCLPQLVEAWLSILQLHDSAPALSAMCLHTVALYVPWIPIGLVANASWLATITPFLRTPALHDGACAVLIEMVLKRMDAQPKLEHLQAVRIVPLLTEGVQLGVGVTAKLSALVSALCMEVLDVWDRLASVPALSAQATDMLSHAFPLLLQCFASDEMDISQSTLAFLHTYIGRLRKLLPSPKELATQEPHLQHLLLTLGRKSVYPADHDFERPDEDEEAFGAYRRELSTLFKNIARVHAGLAQEFVRSTLGPTLESLTSVPWTHLEVALWLLYTLGEGLPEQKMLEKDGFFHQLMVGLLSSSASSYPHRAVTLLVQEIEVRYYRFFLTNPTYLPAALSVFLDERGLYNACAAVRAKACYLLLRFVKQTIKSASGEASAGYVEVVRTLLDLIGQQACEDDDEAGAPHGGGPNGAAAYPNGMLNGYSNGIAHSPAAKPGRGTAPQLSHAEQCHLYETCGLILGTAGLATREQAGEHLRLLLERPLRRLQVLSAHAAAANAAGGTAAPAIAPPPARVSSPSGGERESIAELRATEAAFQISVIAVVSKGFAALPPEATLLRESFSRATRVALVAMGACGDAPDVRSKALMLLHRMVETLGEELLAFLDAALPELLLRADAKELIELVTLINQLVLKWKSKVADGATAIFAALAAASFTHLAALDAAIASSSSATVGTAGPATEDVRERRNLLRCFYSLVHSLVHSDLTTVLAAPQNTPHMAPSLRLLITGCVEGPDLSLQRQCFAILQRLVELWVGSLPGFDQYVLSDVLPVCFQAPSQPHFTLKNAAALPLLESSASLQKAVYAKLGNEMAVYLRDQLLPSLGCTAEFAAEYARHVCEADVRQLRDFLKAVFAAQQQ